MLGKSMASGGWIMVLSRRTLFFGESKLDRLGHHLMTTCTQVFDIFVESEYLVERNTEYFRSDFYGISASNSLRVVRLCGCLFLDIRRAEILSELTVISQFSRTSR